MLAALANPVQEGVRCEVGVAFQLFQQISKHGFDGFDAFFGAGWWCLWFVHVRLPWRFGWCGSRHRSQGRGGRPCRCCGPHTCLLPHHDVLQPAQGLHFFGGSAAGHFHAGDGGVHPGVHAVGAEAVALAFDHGGHVGQKFFQRSNAQLQGLDIDGCWAGGCCGCGHGGAFFDS